MRCWTASRGCTGAPWATSTGSLETRNVSLQQAVGEEHEPIAGHDRQRLHPILELAQPEPDPRSRAATAALRHRWRGSAWPATRRQNGEEMGPSAGQMGCRRPRRSFRLLSADHASAGSPSIARRRRVAEAHRPQRLHRLVDRHGLPSPNRRPARDRSTAPRSRASVGSRCSTEGPEVMLRGARRRGPVALPPARRSRESCFEGAIFWVKSRRAPQYSGVPYAPRCRAYRSRAEYRAWFASARSNAVPARRVGAAGALAASQASRATGARAAVNGWVVSMRASSVGTDGSCLATDT